MTNEKTIDLYSKFPKESFPYGKRVKLLEGLGKTVPNSTFLLWPDKPTPVPETMAKQFLARDPHIVSTKPYKKGSEEVPDKAPKEPDNPPKPLSETNPELFQICQEITMLTVDDVTMEDVERLAEKIDYKFGPAKNLEPRFKGLKKAAEEKIGV